MNKSSLVCGFIFYAAFHCHTPAGAADVLLGAEAALKQIAAAGGASVKPQEDSPALAQLMRGVTNFTAKSARMACNKLGFARRSLRSLSPVSTVADEGPLRL